MFRWPYRRGRWFALGVMRQKLFTATLACSLCFWAAGASAQDVDATIRRAEAEGLPAAVLKDKVREGRAKGVPTPRISAVVQRLASHMREMRPLLKRGKQLPPDGLLVAAAEARLSGVKSKTLRALAPPGSGLGAARRIDALVDLHQRGYAAKKAVGLVRQVASAELAGVGLRAERMRKRGFTRAEVLDSLLRRVRTAGTLRGAARQSGTAGGGGGRGPGGGSGGGQGPQTRHRGGR